jgi:hypothetical protein
MGRATPLRRPERRPSARRPFAHAAKSTSQHGGRCRRSRPGSGSSNVDHSWICMPVSGASSPAARLRCGQQPRNDSSHSAAGDRPPNPTSPEEALLQLHVPHPHISRDAAGQRHAAPHPAPRPDSHIADLDEVVVQPADRSSIPVPRPRPSSGRPHAARPQSHSCPAGAGRPGLPDPVRARYGRARRRKALVKSLMPLRLAKYGVPPAETSQAGRPRRGSSRP